MHYCVNLVCQGAGTASAVLLRAGRVIAGPELARQRRPGGSDRDLARGPARLCQALAIDRALDGADACDPASPLRIRAAQPVTPPAARPAIQCGPRVGVSTGAEVAWRFWRAGDPTVSPYRPHVPRRPRPG
jgi:DNA-3-methyladenine glycosylase